MKNKENILIINICKEKLHYVRNFSKSGILDHPKVQRKINTGLLYFEFVKPIEDILRNERRKYFIRHYKELNKIDLEQSSKLIICGTSLKDNDFVENFDKFSWILDYKKPILGICGGMHIIGLLFGGKLKKKTEIGLYKKYFFQEFLGFSGDKEVYHLHNYYVDFNYLNNFEVNCKSKQIVQAVKYRDKEIYGVLFHPEVRNKELILTFCKLD